MKAEGKTPKHRIGPIKGMGSMRREFVRAVTFLGKHIGVTIDSDDIRRAESTHDGGVRLRLNTGTGGGAGDVSLALSVSDAGVVTPGTVQGIMPTIGGTRLDAGTPPTLTIPGSGTRYVVINITGTFNSSTLGGATFIAASLASPTATITLETTAPSAADLKSTTGSFKLHLATFVNGVKTAQIFYGPVTFTIQDELDGSGTGNLVATYAIP